MLLVQNNVDLKNYNTLALHSVAEYFVEVNSCRNVEDAIAYAKEHQLNILILSGGSNILLPEKINALVMKMNIQGIELTDESDDFVCLKVGAGQVWHDFVSYTTAQGYYGLQNLALIPGLVGAAPVQNIGAYGVEVGDFIQCVEVYDIHTQTLDYLTAEQCQFAYRDSLFKQNTGRFVILAVYFLLSKQPKFMLNYGDLKTAVGDNLTAENVQQQVIQIRQSKLPNPQEFANVGSFFKNPVISSQKFVDILDKYPQVPHYPQPNGDVKLAAGWLIEQSGWKGKKLNQVGMFERQALVLVNYGDATLSDVQMTYRQVQQDVLQKFSVLLEPEPVLFDEQGLIITHDMGVKCL